MIKSKQDIIRWLTVVLLFTSCGAVAKERAVMTLDSCQAMAVRNFPLIKQYGLIEQTRAFSIANAQKGYLPRFNVSGQATYQSDVTQIPFSPPGMEIPVISKDQYRLYGEVSQSVTDLFTLKDQTEYIDVRAEIDLQKATVELYQLRKRINELYFGILLIDAQMEETRLLGAAIQTGIDETMVAISNGVALNSAADNLTAELLKVHQRMIELKATRQGYSDMLALFTGQPSGMHLLLKRPSPQRFLETINRPELKLFDLQQRAFDVQKKLLTTKNIPRLSLFFQGGIGRPGLNMLNNDFQGYYIGGVRLNWNITGYYTYKSERKTLAVRQREIAVQEETFLFNTRLLMTQQQSEIRKVQELIATDKSIIALREKVRQTTQHQLQYGTATTNDYLLAVNAEDQARQNLILHEIQLLMTAYNARITSGN